MTEPAAGGTAREKRVPDGWGRGHMDEHQRSAIERARIAWHGHQFEHDCYGQDCAEDRALYHAYEQAIKGGLAEPGEQSQVPGRPAADE